jgi:Ala-tRNA(Pro) deacylase
MSALERLRTHLEEQGAGFEVHEHAEAFTAQELAQAEHVPGRAVAKVVMAVSDGGLLMLVLPASYGVNLERLAAALGRSVRLAHEEEFTPVFPDCDAGAMPPFGNLYGLTVYVDPSLATDPRIVFQAGTHTHTIAMAYTDFARLVGPEVVSFADPL